MEKPSEFAMTFIFLFVVFLLAGWLMTGVESPETVMQEGSSVKNSAGANATCGVYEVFLNGSEDETVFYSLRLQRSILNDSALYLVNSSGGRELVRRWNLSMAELSLPGDGSYVLVTQTKQGLAPPQWLSYELTLTRQTRPYVFLGAFFMVTGVIISLTLAAYAVAVYSGLIEGSSQDNAKGGEAPPPGP